MRVCLQGVGHRFLAGEGPNRVTGDGEDHGEDEKGRSEEHEDELPALAG